MRGAGKVGLYALVGGALLVAAQVPPAHASVTHDLALLKQQEAALQGRLDRNLRRRDHTLNALRLVEDRVAREGARLVTLKDRERLNQDKLTRLRHREAVLQGRLAQEETVLRRQVVAAYMAGRAGGLQIFLSQEQPTTVDRMLEYYRYIVSARIGAVRAVQGVLAQARAAAQAAAAARARLTASAVHVARQQRRLEQALARRRTVLARLNRAVQSKHVQLAALKARAHRLERLLARLRQLPHVGPPVPSLHGAFAAHRGHLPLPLRATSGPIRLKQGPQGLQRWAGVFMPGRPGQAVYAVFPGRVVYANWLRGYGLLLILQNGDGYMTLYGHCETLLETVGSYVQGGQPIATVGNSGGFGRTGLYFDISHDGRPVNPLAWLAH